MKFDLFFFSGKSDDEIRQRLKEVYDLQKMREKTMKWSPFFSHLLQSRAALLQDTSSQLNLKTMPLSQPDFFHAPSQTSPHTTAPQNGGDQTPSPDSLPPSVFSLATSPQTQNRPGEPGVPAQLCRASFQTDPQVPSVTAALQTPTAQDGVSPTASNSDNPSAQSTKHFTLPLIRSKTGRIILPSSLKPSKFRPSAPTRIKIHFCVSLYSYRCIFFIFSQSVRASIHSWLWMGSRKKRIARSLCSLLKRDLPTPERASF